MLRLAHTQVSSELLSGVYGDVLALKGFGIRDDLLQACVYRHIPVQTLIGADDAAADGWSLKGASAPPPLTRNQPNAP